MDHQKIITYKSHTFRYIKCQDGRGGLEKLDSDISLKNLENFRDILYSPVKQKNYISRNIF